MTTATIKRVATTVANMSDAERNAFLATLESRCSAPQSKPAPKAVKATAKRAKGDWRSKRRSPEQATRNASILAAINGYERKLIAVGRANRESTVQSLELKGSTKGAYHDAYQNILKPLHASLRAEVKALGL